MRTDSPRPLLALILGACCVTAVSLTGGRGMRLSDAGMLVAAAAGLSLLPNSLHRSRVVQFYLLVVALSVCWIWAELQYGALWGVETGASMILVRWLAAIPAAFFLWVLARNPINRRFLLSGIVIGLLVDISLLGYDYASYELTGKPAFVWDNQVWWVNDTFRASGIEGGPNAASIGADFIVPFLLGLATELRLSRWMAGAAAALAIFVYVATQSRGEFAVSMCLIMVYLARTVPLRAMALTAICLGLAGLALAVLFSTPQLGLGGKELTELTSRFTNLSAIKGNADFREMTIAAAFALALANPLGMGASYPQALEFSTGYSATHNGFLQLALLGGIPLAVFMALVLILGTSRIFRGRSGVQDWVAAYIIGISFFEAIFFEPYLPLLLLWCASEIVSPSFEPHVRPMHKLQLGLIPARRRASLNARGT